MAAPIKPVARDPDSVYIHITSASTPSQIELDAETRDVQLRYVGPVGELKGEHIFELCDGERRPVKKSEGIKWKPCQDSAVSALKMVEGVQSAKVLETKQRVKRGGGEADAL